MKLFLLLMITISYTPLKADDWIRAKGNKKPHYEFKKDKMTCITLAYPPPGPDGWPPWPVKHARIFFAECMEGHGWEKSE